VANCTSLASTLHLWQFVLLKLHFHAGLELEHLEHFEAAASAHALHLIPGVGDILQFIENEPRDDEHRSEKARQANLLDAAVR